MTNEGLGRELLPPVMMAIAVAATLGSGVRNVLIAMTIVLVAPMTRVASARGSTSGASPRKSG